MMNSFNNSLGKWIEALKTKVPLKIDLDQIRSEQPKSENRDDDVSSIKESNPERMTFNIGLGPSPEERGSTIDEASLIEESESEQSTIDSIAIDPSVDEEENTDMGSERIWDLSELDPDLAKNVFRTDVQEVEEDSVQVEEIASQNEYVFSNEESLKTPQENGSEGSDVEVPDPPKPINVKRVTVSDDDVDTDSGAEESVDVRPLAQEQEDDELDNDGEIESSMEDDDMFSDDVKVRPYVKTLLDKHGQVTAHDLLEEMRSVHDMIKAKR